MLIIGASSTGKIVSESGVPSSHIYHVLDSLSAKGLVTKFTERNVMRFEVVAPDSLLRLFEERKRKILSHEAELKDFVAGLRMQTARPGEGIRTYEGIAGIKSSIERMLATLKAGETYYVLGAPAIANKKLNAFFVDVHKRRVRKKIKFRILYNRNAAAYATERKRMPYTKVRLLDMDTPTEICIYHDVVQVIIFSERPVLLEIKSKETAKSMLQYFEMMWKRAG